nr:hypothetical protein [Tanacetum cinerariifolium]
MSTLNCHNTVTTSRPIPFPTTTPHAEILISFVIISDSDDEITTLPVRPAPPSSDSIPALSSYLLDFGDNSSDENLSETAESLHTQTASTPRPDVGLLLETISILGGTRRIEEIRYHQKEILMERSESDERIEILEQELETMRSRAEASDTRLHHSEVDMRELMGNPPMSLLAIKEVNRSPIQRRRNIVKLSSCDAIIALGWLLEEIHVTWAHLEKKQTRLQLYTKYDEENAYSS